MKNIRDFVGQELKWMQPHALKMEYNLQNAEGEVVATLHFKSSFVSLAKSESADGCWTFKRVGFMQRKTTITECDSEEDVAVFKNTGWVEGGTLELADGSKYLAKTNFWMTEYEITTESGVPLLKYHRVAGILNMSATVDIESEATDLKELGGWIGLGWYLGVMLYMKPSASGGAA